jgi:hypothetical protein
MNAVLQYHLAGKALDIKLFQLESFPLLGNSPVANPGIQPVNKHAYWFGNYHQSAYTRPLAGSSDSLCQRLS